MNMTESSLKGYKTLWKKEKLLVTSNFSFSYSVFKRLILQTRKNRGLFGKVLIWTGLIFCYLVQHYRLDSPKIQNTIQICTCVSKVLAGRRVSFNKLSIFSSLKKKDNIETKSIAQSDQYPHQLLAKKLLPV